MVGGRLLSVVGAVVAYAWALPGRFAGNVEALETGAGFC